MHKCQSLIHARRSEEVSTVYKLDLAERKVLARSRVSAANSDSRSGVTSMRREYSLIRARTRVGAPDFGSFSMRRTC